MRLYKVYYHIPQNDIMDNVHVRDDADELTPIEVLDNALVQLRKLGWRNPVIQSIVFPRGTHRSTGP